MMLGTKPIKLLILCILDHLIKTFTLKQVILINLIQTSSGGGHISGIIFLQCHTVMKGKLSLAVRMTNPACLVSAVKRTPFCPYSCLILCLFFYAQKDYLIIIVISPKYHETVTNASFYMENDETLNTVYIHKQVQFTVN